MRASGLWVCLSVGPVKFVNSTYQIHLPGRIPPLFHLLIIHNNFLDGEIIALQLASPRKRQETNIKLRWREPAIKAEKRQHLSKVQIKNMGGLRWVIIWAALWLVQGESSSRWRGKCLEGKRGRCIICWFMATLSDKTVIRIKWSPWCRMKGDCYVFYNYVQFRRDAGTVFITYRMERFEINSNTC